MKRFIGFWATLKDGDTLWYENIKLVKSNILWNFEVTGQGETSPTVFELTSIEKGKFISENGLKALISGDDMEIVFDFKRISP
jgi:hypothetical protein